MVPAPLRADFSLVRQGVSIGWEFGRQALTALAQVAELVENSVYESGSLRGTPTGVSFVLRNPPLRMGMFDRIALLWDGAPLDPEQWKVSVEGEPERAGTSVSPGTPIGLPIGVRSTFELRLPAVQPGEHRVRMEFHSVAIPPLVWLEFSDKVTT